MEKNINKPDIDALGELLLSMGAHKVGVVSVCDIVLERAYRAMCEQNLCGRYGKCHTCPPDVGDIDSMMSELRSYGTALVYQTVGQLEDSFDIESMIEAGNVHNALARSVRSDFDALGYSDALHLGAGGCRLCERCAKEESSPCRYPELAMASLEAYGVDVMSLARLAGMNYINGQNTVTYFGAVLFTKQ